MLLRLKDPPIVEVVCGFFFAPMAALTPLVIGKYWAKKADVYTKAELQPPVLDQPGFSIGVGPLRSWLISKDNEWVIQIQPDRFYFNWRRQSTGYPHFHDVDGKSGVLTHALDEQKQFFAFCERELGQAPAMTRIELAKIDFLSQERKHFSSFEDLGTVLPLVAALRATSKSDEPIVQLVTNETREGCDLRVQLTNALAVTSPTWQIETRAATAATPNIEEAFKKMNGLLNDTFFALIAPDRLDRFGGTT